MPSPESIALVNAVSRVLGWIYFTCWSLSFYPQPILNYRRRSARGLAIDFPICNILGFSAHTISQAAFWGSSTIRSQYASRHPKSPEPTVRFNDLVFALHGLVLVLVWYSQFFPRLWGFEVGTRQTASPIVVGIFWGSCSAILILTMIVREQGQGDEDDPYQWAWIDVVYGLTYIKLIVTFVKYMPQLFVNYKRGSTVGWNIGQNLLDLSGGVLSLLQLFIDASLQRDWSGLTGNPVKLGLGSISIFFDLMFMAQHYVIYRHVRKSEDWQGTGEGQVERRLEH